MDNRTREAFDSAYRNLVNKREALEEILASMDEDFFNLEKALYEIHEEGWTPGDLFYED